MTSLFMSTRSTRDRELMKSNELENQAAGKAIKAIIWPSVQSRLKQRESFNSLGFSAEGTLIFMPMAPQQRCTCPGIPRVLANCNTPSGTVSRQSGWNHWSYFPLPDVSWKNSYTRKDRGILITFCRSHYRGAWHQKVLLLNGEQQHKKKNL